MPLGEESPSLQGSEPPIRNMKGFTGDTFFYFCWDGEEGGGAGGDVRVSAETYRTVDW